MNPKKLYAFIGKTKKYVFYSVFFIALHTLATCLLALSFGKVIENVILNAELKLVVSVSLIILSAWLFRSISLYLSSTLQSKVLSEVKQNLRIRLLDKLKLLGAQYQNHLSSAEVINMGTDTIEQMENYYGRYLSEYYGSFASSMVVFLVLLTIHFKLAILFLFLAPIIPLFLKMMLKMVAKMQKKYWRKYEDVGSLFLDSLEGITSLKIFQADEKRAAEMDQRAEAFREETMKILKMQLSSITFIEWVAYGGAIALIVSGFFAFSKGLIPVWQMIALLIIALEAFKPMITLTSSFHVAMTGVAAGERLIRFLELVVEDNHGKEAIKREMNISLQALSYTYPDAKEPVLKNIHFTFRKEHLTAIVGKSGCGKSTLAKILASEISDFEGKILFDDRDYRIFSKTEIEKKITRVAHNAHIFDMSVRENLRMAKENLDDNCLIASLKRVQLWDEIKERGGLDLQLTSNGSNLSGGQAQRLAIARAILNDSAVYIFDEATSNIDIESEKIILKLIEEIAEEKNVIIISHRLKAIENAENIIVMSHGEIVETGNHQSLMLIENGLYKNLVKQQEKFERWPEDE